MLQAQIGAQVFKVYCVSMNPRITKKPTGSTVSSFYHPLLVLIRKLLEM